MSSFNTRRLWAGPEDSSTLTRLSCIYCEDDYKKFSTSEYITNQVHKGVKSPNFHLLSKVRELFDFDTSFLYHISQSLQGRVSTSCNFCWNGSLSLWNTFTLECLHQLILQFPCDSQMLSVTLHTIGELWLTMPSFLDFPLVLPSGPFLASLWQLQLSACSFVQTLSDSYSTLGTADTHAYLRPCRYAYVFYLLGPHTVGTTLKYHSRYASRRL